MIKQDCYDCIIVGAGFAGAVAAREMAERGGKRVLVLEKRSHTGGNAYDCPDKEGLIIHKYGPHIFHTGSERVYEYLSRFTHWRSYEHRVLADVYKKLMPVPFNLNSLKIAFAQDKADSIRKTLISTYGKETKISILELKKHSNPDIQELAEYVYRNIFLYYTQKQWGSRPEDIDPSVTARVPVFISEDDRYFQDKYQGIPLKGYAALFQSLLNHPNITLKLDTDAGDFLQFGEGNISFNGSIFEGTVIYTGAVDELFSCRFGCLPYRALDFELETYGVRWKQPCGTVNYTVSEPYTRITEFKHLTGQHHDSRTTVMREYPCEYHGGRDEIPCYPVISAESVHLYNRYMQLAAAYPDFHLLARLAEYKYYNIDAVIEKTLELADKLI